MPGILKVNQKVEVARSGEGEFYPALIQDVADDFFCITIPYLRGMPLVLVPGEQVDVRVIESDAAYFFTAAVLGRRRDEIPLYGLSIPTEVKRIQRRRFARVETLLEVWYAPVPQGDEAPAFRQGWAVNLSGGGLCLGTDYRFEIGDQILLRFTLDLGERRLEVATQGRIVRRDVMSEGSPGSGYRYGVEFLDLPMREQDLICRYVFRKMAERRRLR